LQTDYVDLYQLHSPPMEALDADDEWVKVLEALRDEGKVRAVGISVRSPDDGLVAIEKFGFDCIQVNFNLTDQRAVENGLFAQCEKNNVGVIVRTPLCFGFLTGDYSAETEYDSSDHRARWSFEQRKRWAEAHEIFARVGIVLKDQTAAQFALKFCLSYQSVSTVIPGMLNTHHVEENVGASNLNHFSEPELKNIFNLYLQNEFIVSSKVSEGSHSAATNSS
jgi:aryl-alcohol dehydrogenase-like predicted oxidoreductase